LPTDSPAIRTQDIHHTSSDYTESDSFEEKMSKLDVDLQLTLSILAGLVIPEGSAKYLKERKQSFRSVERAFVYDISTVTEKVELESKELKEMKKTPTIMDSTDATHVVVQIDWGAKCFVSVTDHNHENDEKTEFGGKISAILKYLKSFVGDAGGKQEKGKKDNWNKLSVNVFGDVLPDDIPTTVDGAGELIRKIPELVKKCNGGKGKPVTYHMIPLPSHTKPIKEVPQTEVFRVNVLFGRIDELKQTASEVKFKEDSKYVQRCERIVTKIESLERKLRNDIQVFVVAIRSSEDDSKSLANLCLKYENEVNETEKEVKKYQEEKEKEVPQSLLKRAIPGGVSAFNTTVGYFSG